MSAPEQQAADPRQPAWDAVFAYIRTLPREGGRPSVVERNAMIWRGVNAALVAVGYPGEYEQAAPVQADLHQRIAQALAATDVHWGYHCGFSTAPDDDMTGAYVTATAAAVGPELAALREQLGAVRRLHTFTTYMSIDICDECSIKRRTGPRPDDWERMAVIPWPCPTTLAAARPTT